MDRIRNEEVHIRAGIGRELASRVDQRLFRWFELCTREENGWVQYGFKC